jgi:formylglycine-generating enzyme required for sulfatase activity
VIWVSLAQAQDYCRWLSKVDHRPYRVPSEEEWEKAARGTDGRLFPWGNTFDAKRCHHRKRTTAAVTAHEPGGDSPFGVSDMAGNVREWTSTVDRGNHVLRGGGRDRDRADEQQCSYRHAIVSGAAKSAVGFRVVMSDQIEVQS